MRKACLVLLGLLLCAQPAFASFGIVSVTPNVVQVSAPPDARKGIYTSTTEVRVWYEGATNVTTPLDTNHNGTPGTYVDPTAGGKVSGDLRSYMVHFDPGSAPDVKQSGSITFENPILGLIFKIRELVASDSVLGPLTTTYDTGHNRGVELTEPAGSQFNDKFTISADGKTLTFNMLQTGTTSFDEMRVVTAVPELATIGTWGLLGLGLAVALRRKWVS